MLASFLIYFFPKNVIQEGGQFLKKNVDKNRKKMLIEIESAEGCYREAV
jgi:hypothetical protein